MIHAPGFTEALLASPPLGSCLVSSTPSRYVLCQFFDLPDATCLRMHFAMISLKMLSTGEEFSLNHLALVRVGACLERFSRCNVVFTVTVMPSVSISKFRAIFPCRVGFFHLSMSYILTGPNR